MNLFITALLFLTLLISKTLFYIVMGIYTAILFCKDKQAAVERKRRTPEKKLLLASLLGGAYGALITIFLIRHKSSKPAFYVPVIFCAILHTLLIILF